MTFSLTRQSGAQAFGISGVNDDVTKANEFLRALAARMLSSHTIRAYGYDLIEFFRWQEVAAFTLDQLTSALLLDFVRFEQGRLQNPRTINRRLSTIQLFYRFATGEPLPNGTSAVFPGRHYRGRGNDRNLGLHSLRPPSTRRVRVKAPHTLVQPLELNEIHLFLSRLTRYRDFIIFYSMLLCGLRSQEVIDLQCNDISFDDQSFLVRGKGKKERVLPLPSTVAHFIRSYLTFERPERCSTNSLLVVLQGKNRGKPLTPAGLRSFFRFRRRAPALKRANAHRLRHTFGVNMARQGLNLPVIQRLMGHSDGITTLQYINLSMVDLADDFQRAAKRLEQQYQIKR